MPADELAQTAKALVSEGKGLLAADESTPTIKKRFEKIGAESTEETRRAYRELLFTTDGIEEFISGVIMFDETLRQAQGKLPTKILEEKGIIPGIKVDKRTHPMANFPGEKITEGLDGLRERLSEYKNLGARFTKWRAVITIGKGIPTDTCIDSNSEALARFAALSQEAGLVPIVEPEVLMDGSHEINRCAEVTTKTLKSVFSFLSRHKIELSGMLLKPNMVIPGKDSKEEVNAPEVAEKTLKVMRETVPDDIPGIVFLSGGQSPQVATKHLNAMNEKGAVPWEVGFSFARALQKPVLEKWRGKKENEDAAQKAFYNRTRLAGAARYGEYTPEMEKESHA